ncbi:hypothetical protein HK103_005923 [Boothiomyces macroporosus]|uniref:Uncharacterized protein n=1 Tax=Boothiomyces macroporosus TaxID=261099 RepID=A0AAD5ULI3_9FUNG|nr:hypothetical protein HK103_005923 [Boothiomyces macroporosus]
MQIKYRYEKEGVLLEINHYKIAINLITHCDVLLLTKPIEIEGTLPKKRYCTLPTKEYLNLFQRQDNKAESEFETIFYNSTINFTNELKFIFSSSGTGIGFANITIYYGSVSLFYLDTARKSVYTEFKPNIIEPDYMIVSGNLVAPTDFNIPFKTTVIYCSGLQVIELIERFKKVHFVSPIAQNLVLLTNVMTLKQQNNTLLAKPPLLIGELLLQKQLICHPNISSLFEYDPKIIVTTSKKILAQLQKINKYHDFHFIDVPNNSITKQEYLKICNTLKPKELINAGEGEIDIADFNTTIKFPNKILNSKPE